MPSIRSLATALCATACLLCAPLAARAAVSCGNGVVEGGEECDGGPHGAFVDGDPASGACTTGARCYFRFTCCKFNCQYVGTPDAPCADGNVCDGPDTCDQVGICHHGPKLPDGSSCDDGLFCDGVETCRNGICTASTGNPCPETACTRCDEQRRSCFKPEGTTCSDGSDCVEGGTCDGGGSCRDGVLRSGPCDDGLYCNGDDACAEGACSVHDGDPCTGPDGDGNCNESCDEQADSCLASDPDGSGCSDGLFCDGDDDTCQAGACLGSGPLACDDTNTCTVDACNEAADACTHTSLADGDPCDDSNLCTLEDLCEAGTCEGSPVLLRYLCPWTVVQRANEDGDIVKTGFQVLIDGDTCGGTMLLGGRNRIVSDLVSGIAGEDTPLRIAPDSVIGENIESAGGGARAYPRSGFLPYLTPATAELAPGSLSARDDGAGHYDLSGAGALTGDCLVAREAYAQATSALDALPPTAGSYPAIRLAAAQTLTIAASDPGGLNVIDVEGGVKLGTDAVLELDGGGDADTIVVLRIDGRLKMQLRSTLALTGGLRAERTLVFVRGRGCQISDLTLGGGTLLCSPARVRVGHTAAWIGAVFADGRVMKIGDRSTFLYRPFQGF